MAPLPVFLDANVLYPADLRNLLMHLALVGLFQPKWSKHVHEEWIESLLRKRPDLTREKLERTRQLMEKAAPDATVTGYEHRIAAVALPDPDDRHILAAALQARAAVIVTCNLSDFPATVLEKHGVEAQHPDDFILQLFALDPAAVLEAVQNHRVSLRNPAKTTDEYLNSLEKQGLKQTALALRAQPSEPHTPPY